MTKPEKSRITERETPRNFSFSGKVAAGEKIGSEIDDTIESVMAQTDMKSANVSVSFTITRVE